VIGSQGAWKVIHRLTALVWIGGLVHTFMEGTDAGQAWFIALIGITAAPAVVLLVARLAGYTPASGVPSTGGAATLPATVGPSHDRRDPDRGRSTTATARAVDRRDRQAVGPQRVDGQGPPVGSDG
jgi:DMSO/TMAO reductase YedYZ heme-binding membrane subunit